MKQTLAMISIIGALIFGSIGALLAADFQAGVAAYQKGDYAAALREWTPLAEKSDAEAQNNLGVVYFEGQGARQDYVTAHMWANIAPVNGSEIAPKIRNVITKEMSPAQIHAAQKRAKDCIAKNYKSC